MTTVSFNDKSFDSSEKLSGTKAVKVTETTSDKTTEMSHGGQEMKDSDN